MNTVKKITKNKSDVSVVGATITVLVSNTTKKDYGLFTDKIVAVQKKRANNNI